MYVKRIQLTNCGPIEHIDITFPFDGENPRPILLVGENGSGKSILLSYILNGLLQAQGRVFPENSEVAQGKIYKFGSPSYIRVNKDFSCGRVDFDNDLYCEEIQLNWLKKNSPLKPDQNVGAYADDLWKKISDENTGLIRNNFSDKENVVRNVIDNHSILYFPANRFEEPAWLNEENLKNRAQYMKLDHVLGYTNRKIINYSPLHDNQNWIFEILFDRYAFERLTTLHSFPILDAHGKPERINLPVFTGHKGTATDIYNIILSIVRIIFRADGNLRLGIGTRLDRKVSLMRGDEAFVPNIFQLSSGETSLLNLFLSILRDFDLSKVSFTNINAVQGVVIVDEIDLHLHVIHQHKILPKLIKMFPRIQFIVTTHSPLFVLGMENSFGPDGFDLYKLPHGQQISPEEFSEFRNAYESLMNTRKFSNDIQRMITDSQKPVVFMEGATDVKYIEKAAELLDRQEILERVQIENGDGAGGLYNVWRHFNTKMIDALHNKVLLIYDCDKSKIDENKGSLYKRSIPKKEEHPLHKGSENLFEKATLEKALESKSAFIDIDNSHSKMERGVDINVPEKWNVNDDEKTNLCDWICANATADDFKHFEAVFDLLVDFLAQSETETAPSPITDSAQIVKNSGPTRTAGA